MALIENIILHGFLEGVQWRDFFQVADTPRLRGHFFKLRKDQSRLDLRKFTFSQRVVNVWNFLTADVVTASTVGAFQNQLEAHLKNLPIAKVCAIERTVPPHSLVFILVIYILLLKPLT